MSATPYRVTEDWAKAPVAARAAMAIRDFFIASFSKVKQRAPDRGRTLMQNIWCSRRFPGPTSFWEVDGIAPEDRPVRKEITRDICFSLQACNK
jgi:hypothetical protein